MTYSTPNTGQAPEPCQHVVDNTSTIGLIWHCVRAPHPTEPDAHYMHVDELATKRAQKASTP